MSRARHAVTVRVVHGGRGPALHDWVCTCGAASGRLQWPSRRDAQRAADQHASAQGGPVIVVTPPDQIQDT